MTTRSGAHQGREPQAGQELNGDLAGEQARKAARRAAARRLHPDLGGDAEEFARVMATFDDRRGSLPRAAGAEAPTPVVVRPVLVRSRGRRTRQALASTRRGLVRRAQQQLPSGFPGARRYGVL